MGNFIESLAGTDALQPLVVCGAARSGTRMATDLLNLHPAVAVQNEMHSDTIEAFFEMLAKIDATFDHHSARKGRRLDDAWRRSRSRLAHAFLASAAKKAPTGHDRELVFHGIKTPGFERYFAQFEACFDKKAPAYVYCLRSADKVWRSWASLGYADDVATFERRYLRSLRQALAMQRAAGERFVLFDLDGYVAAEDKFAFIGERLYGRLGLERADSLREMLLNAPNRNSIERHGAEVVRNEQMEREMAMLVANEKIRELRVKLGTGEFAERRPAPAGEVA